MQRRWCRKVHALVRVGDVSLTMTGNLLVWRSLAYERIDYSTIPSNILLILFDLLIVSARLLRSTLHNWSGRYRWFAFEPHCTYCIPSRAFSVLWWDVNCSLWMLCWLISVSADLNNGRCGNSGRWWWWSGMPVGHCGGCVPLADQIWKVS